MKRSLRSLLAGVLAMTMVMGMSVTTFAATLPAEYCIPVKMYNGSIEKWKKEELHTVSLAGGEEYTVWIVSTYYPEHNHTSYGYLYTDGDGNYYLGGSSDKETVIWSFTDAEFGLGATRSAVEENIKGIGQSKCGKDFYLFGWFGETGPEPAKPSSKPIPSSKKNMKLDKEDAVEMEMRVANVAVDKDTFKSEAPAHTVIASEAATDAFGLFDLKVHKPDEKSTANQVFLAKTMVGPNVQILLTQNIYPRRDLAIAENGSAKKLTWNNLPKDQAGPVFAIVYNETDGAYVLNGTLDANGTAVFNGFKLHSASTVTICK